MCVRRLTPLVCALALAPLAYSQNPPAPSVDHVGFPADYTRNMNVLYTYDRPDNKQVRTVYANSPVFSVDANNQDAYPYGSILVMETWRSLQDSAGNPILDDRGRFQKDPAASPTLFVMRKEKGFGADYGPNRNGEWEYVAYHPDGTFQTTPSNSFSCAICHLQADHPKDYVFRVGIHIGGASGAKPTAVFRDYQFLPNTMHARANVSIHIYNDDVIAHTIVDDVPGFVSSMIKPGGSIELRFGNPPGNQPFTWNFHCNVHNEKGTIIVDPAGQ
jgi:cytochrome P460